MSNKPPKMINSVGGLINIQLTEQEAQVVIELLKFASDAAIDMVRRTIIDNKIETNQSELVALNKVHKYSKELYSIIKTCIDIGDPTNDEIH